MKTALAPLLVLLVSLALLVPGVSLPLISLQADLSRQALVVEGQTLLEQQDIHPAMKSIAKQFLGGLKVEGSSRVYDKTRSILGTASDLWQSGYKLVAVLILTFSIIIPVMKSLLLLAVCLVQSPSSLIRLNALLGKWSMADVFAMGVLIACLAANASSSESALLNVHAELHTGFYWFLAYCLVSIAGAQLIARCVRLDSSQT